MEKVLEFLKSVKNEKIKDEEEFQDYSVEIWKYEENK